MGSGGTLWEGPTCNPPTGDLISHDRLNQKTVYIGSSPPSSGCETALFTGQLYFDTNTGLLRIRDKGNDAWQLVQGSYVTNEPNGFPVNTSGSPNPSNQTTIAFVDGTRTFSITPTGASFSVWVNGIEYNFTTAQSVTITNTEGLWYFYFNSSGVLTASQSIWSLEYNAPVAYVNWDSTDLVSTFFADERHMFTMDWRTHYYMHQSIGCRYVSGLGISGYTLNASGDTNVQIGIASGTVFDEDLEFDIQNGVSGTPANTPNFYNQPLNKPATIPVFYQIGATGVWRKQTTANFYVYPHAANTTVYYNLNTAGTWSLADVPNGGTNYYSVWIFACNDIDNPIIAIMGQSLNTSLANLEANDTFSALSIASGLPFQEMKLLYRMAMQHQNAYGGSTWSRVIQVDDFRTQSIGGSASSGGTSFITSVVYPMQVSSGQLSIAYNLQNLGSGDSPSFSALTLTGGATSLTVNSNSNWVSSLTTETAIGITLTATNPTGVGAAYYTPSISGNLVIGSFGVTFTAIADASVSGKLFLSSTTATALKYYDNTPALHQLVVLDTAQSFSGAITFTAEPIINISGSGSVLKLYNPANTHFYTLTTGAIGGDYALNLPVITAADTIEVLGLAQTISAIKTFTAKPVINISGSGNVLDLYNPANTFIYTIVTSAIGASYTLTLPLITANDTIDVLGLAQTFSAAKTFGAGLSLSNSQAIAFGTGGTITFTDATAIIGTSTHYVATAYFNNITFEGASAQLAGTYEIAGTPTVFSTLAFNGTALNIGSSSAYPAVVYTNALTGEGSTPTITGFSLAGTYNIGGAPTMTASLLVSGTSYNLGGASAYFATAYFNALQGEGASPTITGFNLAGTYNIGGTPTFTVEPIINITGSGAVLRLYNPANTYYYTLTTGAIGASYVLNLPVITAADTLATLGLAQTFTAILTISGGLAGTHGQNVGSGDSPTFANLHLGTGKLYFSAADAQYLVASTTTEIDAFRNFTIGYNALVGTPAASNTIFGMLAASGSGSYYDASILLNGSTGAFTISAVSILTLNATGGVSFNGNITFTSTQTVDGIDISATLDQAVKQASAPTFAGLTVNGQLYVNVGNVQGIIINSSVNSPFLGMYTSQVGGHNYAIVTEYDADLLEVLVAPIGNSPSTSILKLDPSGDLTVSGVVSALGLDLSGTAESSNGLLNSGSGTMTMRIITSSSGGGANLAGYQMKTADSSNIWQMFTRQNQLWFGIDNVADLAHLDSAGDLNTIGYCASANYLSGNYGATWGSLPSFPTAVNGNYYVLYDSATATSRIYCYSNNGWHWSALT